MNVNKVFILNRKKHFYTICRLFTPIDTSLKKGSSYIWLKKSLAFVIMRDEVTILMANLF